ncbi:MAG: hypothetical protein AAGG79_02945, partial [Pseudomonadota bacterium]
MLYHFFAPLADEFQLFNLFRYITFRFGGATLTALIIAFVIGPGLIRCMRQKQGKGQPIRKDGPPSHLVQKAGTPTMGGIMILISLVLSVLLWARLDNPYVWIVLGVTVGYGLLGFYDDYMKVRKQSADGVVGSLKLLFQFGVAFVAGAASVAVLRSSAGADVDMATGLAIPFFSVILPLGLMIFPFAAVVIVGSSNAVNLTDGLDGLAIVPVMIIKPKGKITLKNGIARPVAMSTSAPA